MLKAISLVAIQLLTVTGIFCQKPPSDLSAPVTWDGAAAAKWLNTGVWRGGFSLKPHSSVDAVEFAQQYHLNQHLWREVFEWLNTQHLDTLSAGKYPIDGDKAFAIITEGPTKPMDQTKWESHQQYIDLHCVISGAEQIGEAALDKATLTEPFAPGADVAHYQAEGKFYTVVPGEFLLFFPKNVHRAGIQAEGSPTDKKLVIKIAYATQPIVLLDYYFNNEWHKNASGAWARFHYTWGDQENSGFSKLGWIFGAQGFVRDSLMAAPSADRLRKASVYLIVDPDTEAESAHPNYVSAADVSVVREWVKEGGVLVLMGNDKGNAEFAHFNQLAEAFGIHFNEDCVNHVVGENIQPGEIQIASGHPIFHSPWLLYMKDVSSLRLEAPAEPCIVNNGAILGATARYGKGTVFAVGDPWLYNEYIDDQHLPASVQNMKGAEDWVGWLKAQVAR